MTNRVAIVTGGAGLLGREYAQTLADAGANVVVADIDEACAEEVADSVARRSRVPALATGTDVSDEASVDDLVRQTLACFGRVDVLVNNAALDPKFEPQTAGQHTDAFESFPLEVWNLSLKVNLTGMFLCARAVARPMLKQGRGCIINICSTYGLVGPDQRLYDAGGGGARACKPVSYSVTKSAVLGLTHYLAAYWTGKNIRVNALTPGGVFNGHDEGFVERYSARTPLGRMADRTEYNGALLFLASDASSYMTGANLVVDGGWTAW
jgi:2-deoxy-D-gluconate 3-dehydrogenase